MQYVAAIDQGTTSTRCMIFNHLGISIASSQKEHHQIFPKPGWVEHDPLEIWECTKKVVTSAIVNAGVNQTDLAAIGITNQRETTLIWNRITGEPYYNAIVWQDTRTDEICSTLAANGGKDRFRKIVGLPVATYFSAAKIMWLLEKVPGLRDAAERGDAIFGNIDSWLVWNLTGGKNNGIHITDVTNASRTMMMNLKTLDWDKSMLDVLEIPHRMLPEIRPSSSVYGQTQCVLNQIPIAGILGDQQAALFGQACYAQGEAKNTYGTGCFLLLNTGTDPIQSNNGLLTTLGYQLEGQPAVYCLEGSVAISGALVQWFRDNLQIIENSQEIETLANSVKDNGGVYIVPAFSGLFAPYWRSDARGAIVGLTRYANRGHFSRAVLEATAYQTKEVLDAMEIDSGVKLTALKVDGGMVFNQLLMQFQADILDVPVIRPKVSETTSLGAAYVAGLAVGYWQSFEELKTNWVADSTWMPQMDEFSRSKLYADWKKAVTRTFDWVD